MKKGIVLHDFFAVKEGGGRLALLLAQNLDFDLAFGFWGPETYDKNELDKVKKVYDLKANSKLFSLHILRHIYSYLYRTKFLHDYDIVIYSGNYTPLAVRHHPKGKNIFYCHTPAAFLYEKKEHFSKNFRSWQRVFFHLAGKWLQTKYESAIGKMDVILANSANVQARIKTYLGLASVIVYPPCDHKRFSWLGQSDYYLSYARLDKLKRVDLVVQAFLLMPDKKLIVCSSGSELASLQNLAKGAQNIQILGNVSDQELAMLLGKCIATIYIPIHEDFGMTAIESLAAGKPVIGVDEGGLKEILLDQETGVLLASSISSQSICAAVHWLNAERAISMRSTCQNRSELFSLGKFIAKVKDIIEQ